MAPETTLRTGSQKGRRSFFHVSCLCMELLLFLKGELFLCDSIGASEISDACKPLKKRSRASTDVEMASSQYRDTSDSDSRGLNDPQVDAKSEIYCIAHRIDCKEQTFCGKGHNTDTVCLPCISTCVFNVLFLHFQHYNSS